MRAGGWADWEWTFGEWKRFFTELPRLDALVGRVSTSSRMPIFMVGSGMSLPEKPGGPGVPGAAGMVELVRNRLSDDKAALDALNQAFGTSGAGDCIGLRCRL